MASPGWYPDPTGRFPFRYFNGSIWTGDVAANGQRFVDPYRADAAVEPRSSGNGFAIAALSCGVVAIGIGWIPVIFVFGAILAVLALVFGGLGLARAKRRKGAGRGFAIAGLATGLVGLAVAVGGLVLTIVVFDAVSRFENPEPHRVAPVECEVVEGRVEGRGAITNLGDRAAGFSVTVDISRAGSRIPITDVRVRIDSVGPGDTEPYRFTRRVAVDEVDCEVTSVRGPLPFGLVID